MHYHNITTDDMLNGSGLRTVLWTAGCLHHCPGCQNPITWDVQGGIPFDKRAKEELYENLSKPYIDGITFSGGDPLTPFNIPTIRKLIYSIRKDFPDKTIWVYTGYLYEDLLHLDFLNEIDVLVDGRFVEDLKDVQLHWKGSSNQRVIDIKKSNDDSVVLYEID